MRRVAHHRFAEGETELSTIAKFSALFDHKWEQYADAKCVLRENDPDPVRPGRRGVLAMHYNRFP